MKIFVISLIALLLIVSGFFTVKAPIPNGLYAISSIAILLFAFPSYYFLVKSVGIKKAFLVLIILSVYAIVIEMIALKTGIPYGRFDYGERIGYKLFNLLPWTLSFAYVPLVLGTVTISQKIATSKVSVIGISTLLLVLIDLVIDPGAVSLKFWHYHGGGFFYHVPLLNFVGWILTGAIGSYIVYLLIEKNKVSIKIAYSLLCILLFWTSIALWNFLVIPLFIGILLIIIVSLSLKENK